MSVRDRIKFYCDNQNITISSFEKSIKVSNGYINNISKSIGIDKISLIIDIYSNLNIEWLLTGKGSMLREVPTTDAPSISLSALSEKQNPELLAQIAKLEQDKAHLQATITSQQEQISFFLKHNKELGEVLLDYQDHIENSTKSTPKIKEKAK